MSARRLPDAPTPTIAGIRCDRRGVYRVSKLIARHGADMLA
jgi:hypothetical protein